MEWLHLQRRVYRNPLWRLCEFCADLRPLWRCSFSVPQGLCATLHQTQELWNGYEEVGRVTEDRKIDEKGKSHKREQAVCKLNRSGQERAGCCHPQTEHIERPGLSVIVDHDINTYTSYLIVASSTSKEEGSGESMVPSWACPCVCITPLTPHLSYNSTINWEPSL